MHRRQLLLLPAALGLPGAPSVAAEAAVTGTGATFPAKVYRQWAEHYARDTNLRVDYVPAGSSAGVRQIVSRAVDFGATDVPLAASELEKHKLFQFPTLVGGVVPVVNVPGIASGDLRLDADALAAIFIGQITRWNDRMIAALNPFLKLPDTLIQRVVRADGSGTTEVFVAYLRRAASQAAQSLEVQGGRANWPGTVVSSEGSSKLAAAVRSTSGSIGYISSDYVVREQLVPVSLRNKRGEWVAPSIASYGEAVRAGGLFKHGLDATPLIDIEGPGAWPIVTATYVLVPRTPESLERAGRTLNFFYRSFLLGDKAVAGTGFAPLPIATQARIVALLASFRTADGKPLPVLSQARALDLASR